RGSSSHRGDVRVPRRARDRLALEALRTTRIRDDRPLLQVLHVRPTLSEELARCIEFQREFERARAGRAVPCAHGTAYFNDDLPRVFDLNVLSVDLGVSAGAAELVAEAEAVQGAAGLAHRKIAIDDELGSALAPDFRERGWIVNELVVMPHRRPPPPVDVSAVEEVEVDE